MPEKKKSVATHRKESQKHGEPQTKLLPVLDLFRASWVLYKKTFFSYLRVFAVGLGLVLAGLLVGVIFAIPLFISSGGTTQNLFTHPTLQQIAGMILVAMWILAYVALLIIYSLYAPVSYILILTSPTKLSLKELYHGSKLFILPVFLAGLLTSLFVLGGMGLLIIPGIVFGIFFSFVTNVIVLEKLRGMDALKRSFQLVQSHFWGIVLRIILIEVLVSISSNILDGFAKQTNGFSWMKVVSEIYSVVIEWFVVVYSFLLYKQVSSLKVSLPSFRVLWILVVVGLVFFVGLVVYFTVINPLNPHALV